MAARAGDAMAAPELSGREAEVVRRIAQGYTNKEIAALLHVSIKTVETYKLRSRVKLGFDSRVDFVRFALARGWLGSDAAGEGGGP